ncbi:hypothetical protein GCM10010517_51030 [Streptosporangium fragile]|uniref:Uncharacterized protein n=1 Tax=Streptosporangium fragile TaxID=46186 RepID=A0ABP6IIN5_9ACTN
MRIGPQGVDVEVEASAGAETRAAQPSVTAANDADILNFRRITLALLHAFYGDGEPRASPEGNPPPAPARPPPRALLP